MSLEQIVEQLRAERARLDAAISVLEQGSIRHARRGVRRMTEESKARISEAQRRRWAERKASQRKVV